MQNIFVAGDPLLGNNNPYVSNNPADMDALLDRLKQQQTYLEQQKQQVISEQTKPQQSRTPVWDEIDKLVDSLSEAELEMLNNNPEYQQEQQKVMSILNREYMRIMRPLVEETKDGKDTLSNLFDLVKKIKKSASEEVNKNMALFNEYTSKYADMPYAEFIKMKKGENVKGGKK